MSNNIGEIKEDLVEYFKDMDDATFVAVSDVLVTHVGTQSSRISKLSEKFLEDNDLQEAFMNYVTEMRKPSSMLMRHPSDVRMIEDIRLVLLSMSHDRFRRQLSKTSKVSAPSKPKLVSKLTRKEKDDLVMVIENCERHNDNLIDGENTTRAMFDETEANELIDERKRLSKLFTKVLNLIK